MSTRYLRLAIQPRCTDALLVRKALQDALAVTFGLVCAGTYIDVLAVDEVGSEAVVRVHAEDAPRILAAVVGTSRASLRYTVVKTSSFLPSLAG